jgi:uncharacterized alkaline shock family protein YloU
MSDTRLPDPSDRGTLDIARRAISTIAERSISERARFDARPHVTVSWVEPDAFAVAASLTLPYPTQSIGVVLNRLRSEVVDDLKRQTGRSVSRLDLTVDGLSVAPVRPGRRVR